MQPFQQDLQPQQMGKVTAVPVVREGFLSVLYPYFLTLRPRQWTKNLIVFSAPLFAFQLGWNSLLGAAGSFILFSMVSSSFYIFNDVADIQSDRKHPVKCKRPIPSGAVKLSWVTALAVFLLVTSLVLGWGQSNMLGLILLGYAVMQVAYNLRLKHTVILDIIAIAIGFVLRAYAGAVATDITLSNWFLLCTAMLALFLGIEKRKAELRRVIASGRNSTRAVLSHYSLPLLLRMENIVTSSLIIAYSLWSAGPQMGGASTPWMFVTSPFVLYGVFRYQLLSDISEPPHGQMAEVPKQKLKSERPEEILLTDKPILITVLGWIATSFFVLLFNQN